MPGSVVSPGPPARILVIGQDVAPSKTAPVDAGRVAVTGTDVLGGATAPDSGRVHAVGQDVSARHAGSGYSGARIADPAPPPRARLIAQNILNGTWLSLSLPVTDPEVTWNLSGATVITGVFKPEIRELADVGLEPWATWIHLEEAGQVRGSAILQPTTIGHDGSLKLVAIGPHGYASRIPFRDRYSGIAVDPADVVRLIWAHVQSYPRGQLGVTVQGTTPITRGTPARDVNFVTGDGDVVSFVAGPYTLDYWQNTLCGREIESLAKDTPFDFIERCEWTSPARIAVRHWTTLHYPQAGRRRWDLRFAEGENILETAPISEPDDAYADTVIVAGKGEGVSQVTATSTRAVGTRLRLGALVDDKTIDSTQRAKATAEDEIAARLAALVEIPEVVVDADHANAPLGALELGDEVGIVARYPYVGTVSAWHRVVAIRYSPITRRAVLTLTRRGEFR